MYINTPLVTRHCPSTSNTLYGLPESAAPCRSLFLPRWAFWTQTKRRCVLHELLACNASTTLSGALRGMAPPRVYPQAFFFFSSHDTSCTDHFCGSKIAARVPDSDINANLPTALARDVRVLQALLMNCVAVKKALLFFFAALIAAQLLSQYKVSDIPT